MSQRRIFFIASSIVMVISIGLFAFAKQSKTDEIDRRGESLDAILARKLADRGLNPCGYLQGQRFAQYANHMFASSLRDRGIKILFLPSFAPYHGVSLGANTIESVSLQREVTAEVPFPTSNAPSFRKVSPELSYRAYKSIEREIRYAGTLREEMSDGEGFVFFHGDTCAYTWSPQGPNRSATLSEIAIALDEGASEAHIDELVKQLEAQQAR